MSEVLVSVLLLALSIIIIMLFVKMSEDVKAMRESMDKVAKTLEAFEREWTQQNGKKESKDR